MAAEFRASFDEMARQSELDELRKEVEAMRKGQLADIATHAPEVNQAFDEIHQGLSDVGVQLNSPVSHPYAAATTIEVKPVAKARVRKAPAAKAPAAKAPVRVAAAKKPSSPEAARPKTMPRPKAAAPVAALPKAPAPKIPAAKPAPAKPRTRKASTS
jgi:sec-independent protein translocase protein TatB